MLKDTLTDQLNTIRPGGYLPRSNERQFRQLDDTEESWEHRRHGTYDQIGLDLGQMNDSSAIAVVRVTVDRDKTPNFWLVGLEQIPPGMNYVDQCQHVRQIMDTKGLVNPELAIDSTGVGIAVSNLFDSQGLDHQRITITSSLGHRSQRGGWLVGKVEMINLLQVGLQTGEIKILAGIPGIDILMREANNFRETVTDTGHLQLSHRSGQHDDLLLATAIAVWSAAKRYTKTIGAPQVQVVRM